MICEKINKINLIDIISSIVSSIVSDKVHSFIMEINTIQILEDIARSNFNDTNINNPTNASKSIDIKSVICAPVYHDTIFIQIYDNQLYTRSSVSEERHHQILRQLKSVLDKYLIPNTLFAYSTRDEYPHKGDFIFTHAIRKGEITNNILAPCFTFESYPEKEPTNFITYTQTYNELVALGESAFYNKTKWINKKMPTLAFVGSIHPYNYRDVNTKFSGDINVDIRNLDAASGAKFISRADLSNYRYLLHLNGNNGAYASRLKYLMLAGSLVIYNTNFKERDNYQIEYWMNHPIFLAEDKEQHNKCIIQCKTTMECENYIKNDLANSSDASYRTSLNGFNYVKEILKPENVLLYWKILLEQYSANIKNPIQYLIYHHKY